MRTVKEWSSVYGVSLRPCGFANHPAELRGDAQGITGGCVAIKVDPGEVPGAYCSRR